MRPTETNCASNMVTVMLVCLSDGDDKLRVYKNSDGNPPYFYFNREGNPGVYPDGLGTLKLNSQWTIRPEGTYLVMRDSATDGDNRYAFAAGQGSGTKVTFPIKLKS